MGDGTAGEATVGAEAGADVALPLDGAGWAAVCPWAGPGADAAAAAAGPGVAPEAWGAGDGTDAETDFTDAEPPVAGAAMGPVAVAAAEERGAAESDLDFTLVESTMTLRAVADLALTP